MWCFICCTSAIAQKLRIAIENKIEWINVCFMLNSIHLNSNLNKNWVHVIQVTHRNHTSHYTWRSHHCAEGILNNMPNIVWISDWFQQQQEVDYSTSRFLIRRCRFFINAFRSFQWPNWNLISKTNIKIGIHRGAMVSGRTAKIVAAR